MAEIDRGSWESRGRKEPKLLKVVIVALTVAVLFASSLSLLSNPSSEILPAPVPARTAYTSHANITIDDNYGFQPANWTANGISGGSGIHSDPYVINGWGINGAGHQYAIYVGNTTKHFKLSNCSGKNATLAGIYLNNVKNSTVINNDCSNNGMESIAIAYSDGDNFIADNLCANSNYGLIVALSSNCIITDNLCENNSISIGFVSSCNNTVFNNTCRNDSYGGGTGIYLDPYSSDNTIVGNNCSSNIYGITLDIYCCNNTIANNTCNSNNNYGIFLYSSSDNNTLSNNTCSNNGYGIALASSSYNTLSNNNCSSNINHGIVLYSSSNNNTLSNNTCDSNNYCGMRLVSSSYNTLSNNTCSNSDDGIQLASSSDNNTLSNNTCSNNDEGIVLYSSSDNTIAWNQMCNNIGYGVNLQSGANRNMIWNNTFISNNGGGVQAYDDGTNNWWNTSGSPHGYGNYWSDLTTPDTNFDGIVDWSYNLTGSAGAKDYYPLTTPSIPPYIPEFSEIVVPIVGLMLIALIFGRTKKKP